jgi:hypothetical protein
MVVYEGIAGVSITCVRLGGSQTSQVIRFTTRNVTVNSVTENLSALSVKNSKPYRIAITAANCPAILKSKGLPQTIYSREKVISGEFSLVQCDFIENGGTWNAPGFGGYRYSSG